MSTYTHLKVRFLSLECPPPLLFICYTDHTLLQVNAPRTNYGIFSIRFQGPKIWNCIDEAVKSLPSIAAFKRKIKLNFIEKY